MRWYRQKVNLPDQSQIIKQICLICDVSFKNTTVNLVRYCSGTGQMLEEVFATADKELRGTEK